MIFKSK